MVVNLILIKKKLPIFKSYFLILLLLYLNGKQITRMRRVHQGNRITLPTDRDIIKIVTATEGIIQNRKIRSIKIEKIEKEIGEGGFNPTGDK